MVVTVFKVIKFQVKWSKPSPTENSCKTWTEMHETAIWGVWKVKKNRKIGTDRQNSKFHWNGREHLVIPLVFPTWTRQPQIQKGQRVKRKISRRNSLIHLEEWKREISVFFFILSCPNPQSIPWQPVVMTTSGAAGAHRYLKLWRRGTSPSDEKGSQESGVNPIALFSLCPPATWLWTQAQSQEVCSRAG